MISEKREFSSPGLQRTLMREQSSLDQRSQPCNADLKPANDEARGLAVERRTAGRLVLVADNQVLSAVLRTRPPCCAVYLRVDV